MRLPYHFLHGRCKVKTSAGCSAGTDLASVSFLPSRVLSAAGHNLGSPASLGNATTLPFPQRTTWVLDGKGDLGRLTVKVLPSPGVESTWMLPS